MSKEAGVGPLNGITVIDFSGVMAGPYCTRVLAGLGAEVIKIETPEGDPIRRVAPIRDGRSAYYMALNAGKKHITLDLKSPAGLEAARLLIDKADVVVSSFRPGVMARFGLDYATLSAQRPGLVYVTISGFGQEGPDSGRPATAQIVGAITGLDAAIASYQPDPGALPSTGVWIADALGGALAIGGTLAGLRQRDFTGAGCHVDQALEDGVLSMLIHEVQSSQFDAPSTTSYRPLRTLDGYIMVSAVTPRNLEGLCGVIARPDLLTNKRFSDPVQRRKNLAEFTGIIEEWTSQRTGQECESILAAAGVPAAKYRSVAERISEPSFQQRSPLVWAEDGAGRAQMVHVPFRIKGSNYDSTTTSVLWSPEKGADTYVVLEEMLGEEQTRRLLAEGAAGMSVDVPAPTAEALSRGHRDLARSRPGVSNRNGAERGPGRASGGTRLADL